MAHIQADKRAEKSTALPKIDRTYRVVSCGQPFIGQPLADYSRTFVKGVNYIIPKKIPC
jgi:hypothetical protein